MRSCPHHEILERRLAFAAMPFTESSFSELVPSTGTVAVVVADFDGDSALEVISVATGQMFEWTTQRRGFELVGVRLLPIAFIDGGANTVLVRSGRAFDANGDGDQDLFVLGQLGHSAGPYRVLLYENQGNGHFEYPVVVSDYDRAYGGGRLADVDGDRDLDVVRLEDWSENVNGVISAAKTYPVAQLVYDFADADQDGDEDGFTYNVETSTFEFFDIRSGERQSLYSSDLRVDGSEIDFLPTLRVLIGSAGGISIVGALTERVFFANTDIEQWQPSILSIPDQFALYHGEFNGLSYLHLADFDGDQDLDLVALVILDDGSDAIKWFEGLTTDFDLDVDGILSAKDVDRFCQGVRESDLRFDLNADNEVDLDDVSRFTESLGAVAGDATLDGIFNSSDLIEIFQKGKYNLSAEWSSGDWNCDGQFDSSDLIWAFQNGIYWRV
jgi:hypothetical protein